MCRVQSMCCVNGTRLNFITVFKVYFGNKNIHIRD